MATSLHGECLCGAVTFEIEGEPQAFYLCHCRQCRQVTGSGFASNMLITPEAIRWTKGEDNLVRYEDPERDFFKRFCKTCGSGMPHLNRDGSRLTVPVGCLTSSPSMSPQANIFVSETADWLKTGLQAKRFDAFPE